MQHSVRINELEQVIEELTALTAALVDALSEADAASTRLHGVWEGEASHAHQQAQSSWMRDSERLTTALNEMRSVLTTAHQNYRAVASANSAMWS